MRDVLVVGAGPTGLTLAIQLERYGIPVRIVEMLGEPSPWSKAIGIQARTLELFERMGVAESFVEKGIQYREVVVRSDRRPIVQESLSGIRSRYNYVLALPQNVTEAILDERLRALGIQVERTTQLVHLEQASDGVRVHMRGPDAEIDAEFAFVVGCDGAHSTVRHLLDIPFTSESFSESVALADLMLEGQFPRDAISMYLSRGIVAAVLPLPDDRSRIIVARDQEFSETPGLEDLRSMLYIAGADVISCSDPSWISQFTISRRRVASVAKGRVFLAGDSAHIHSALGAQGMNTGIQDAENLAWKIALTMRQGALESLLSSYAIEREAVAATLMRSTGMLSKLVASANPAVRAVRDRAAAFATSIPMVSDRFRDAISELDIVYTKSPIVVYQGRTPDPRPGAHAPDGALARAGDATRTSVFELISTVHYVLLIFTYRRDQFVHETLVAMQRHNAVVDAFIVARDASVAGAHLLDPPGAVFRAYGVEGEPQYVLIRPDGYVAARGAVRDYALLASHLDRTFAPQPV